MTWQQKLKHELKAVGLATLYFGTWLAEPQEDGSRFYSIFRQGFLTPAEIHQLRIPSVVLEGNGLRDYNLYLQNLTEATSALAPPNP